LIPIEHRPYQPKLPLRLLDRFAHAGFHATYRGLLPFSFSRQPLEAITVKQVSLLVDQLPEARVTGDAGEHSIMPTIWTLGGESNLTLQQMPNSVVTYAVRIPAGTKLSFNLGVMSDGQTSDPLTFGLSIKGRASGDRKVFIRAVSPLGAQWIPESV